MSRTAYYICLALLVGWQASMTAAIFYFSHSPAWVTHVFVTSASVLPFLGYLIVFYRSTGFVSSSRIARVAGIILASIAAAGVGFWFLLFLMFGLFMAFGGHHW
jgi:hypothetical protein